MRVSMENVAAGDAPRTRPRHVDINSGACIGVAQQIDQHLFQANRIAANPGRATQVQHTVDLFIAQLGNQNTFHRLRLGICSSASNQALSSRCSGARAVACNNNCAR